MEKQKRDPIKRIVFFDLILLNAIYNYFLFFVKGYNYSGLKGERYLLLLIFYNLIWIIITMIVSRYRMRVNRGFWLEFKKLVFNTLLFVGTTSIYAFINKDFNYSRLVIYGTVAFFFLCSVVSHMTFYIFFIWYRNKESSRKTVLIIGADETTIDLYKKISREHHSHYNVLAYVLNVNMKNVPDPQVMGGRITELKDFFKNHKIDELFITLPTISASKIRKVVETADFYGIRVRMIPYYFEIFGRNFTMDQFDDIPIINVNEIPLDNYHNVLYKNTFDFLFSVVALILLSPVMILISILVKISSRGPIFYSVDRVGIRGKVFKLFKFRTMYQSKKENEKASTQKNDPRITKIGKYLRKFNMDELPQFFNVLKGEMSVVGPRPHRVYLDKLLQNSVDNYMIRHYIKPGITGWAQVNGWRGPTLTKSQREERTQHDLWYIENWTFWLDIKIILMTLFFKKAKKNAF